MNLLKTLEKSINKQDCDRIVQYVVKDQNRFNELVHIFLTEQYRITQRAAWPLSYAAKKHSELIKPHLKKIIYNLEKPGLHDAVIRNTVRLLQFITIPPALQGKTLDLCFSFLQDRKQPVAIRVFSMTVLANLTKVHPALKEELSMIIDDQMPYGSAGFISRGKKVLKQLKVKPK